MWHRCVTISAVHSIIEPEEGHQDMQLCGVLGDGGTLSGSVMLRFDPLMLSCVRCVSYSSDDRCDDLVHTRRMFPLFN